MRSRSLPSRGHRPRASAGSLGHRFQGPGWAWSLPGALLLALFALGQLAPGLHRAAVPHEVCERDGALAHGDDHHHHGDHHGLGERHPEGEEPGGARFSASDHDGHGEHCALVTALERRDLHGAPPPLQLYRATQAFDAATEPRDPPDVWRAVYRFAPKQSPPARG